MDQVFFDAGTCYRSLCCPALQARNQRTRCPVIIPDQGKMYSSIYKSYCIPSSPFCSPGLLFKIVEREQCSEHYRYAGTSPHIDIKIFLKIKLLINLKHFFNTHKTYSASSKTGNTL